MHGRCIGGISGLVAAFGPLASDTEVALRNTIHEQLSLHFGRTDWWASPDLILDDTTTDVLSAAARDHQRKIAKGTVGAGKVIAELMLGSWVMLLSRGGTSSLGKPIDYETNLWRPALRLGFATGTATRTGRIRRPIREQAHSRAANLQRLRNGHANPDSYLHRATGSLFVVDRTRKALVFQCGPWPSKRNCRTQAYFTFSSVRPSSASRAGRAVEPQGQ